MVILLNDDLYDGKSRKKPLESGYCSSSSVSEFKPRKVSCVRDYPPGCGRNAPPINFRQRENVVALVGDKENMLDDERRTKVAVGADCVETHEELISRIQPEMGESSSSLVGKGLVMPVMVTEEEKYSTNMEVLGVGLQKNTELSKELHEVKREDTPQNKTVLEIGALDDGMVLVANSKDWSAQQWSKGDVNVSEGSVLIKSYPRRGVLVTRDYPPFCGRNAPCPTDEECQKVFLRSKSFGAERGVAKYMSLRETVGAARDRVVESRREVCGGNAQRNKSRGIVLEPGSKSQAGTNTDFKDGKYSLGKGPKEIMVYANEKSPKQRFLECGVDRVTGQGLMASPNCMWKQGKGASNTSLDGGMSQRKFTGREKPKCVSKNHCKADYARGSSSKGKSVSSGKAAYGGIDELRVWDEEDTVIDEVVRLPRFYGPSSSNSGDARSKVREMLFHFQTFCRKILRQEEAKLSQSKRIDLEAAKIIKKKGLGLNTGEKLLGPVPGVEVGDEFQYRVELALLGVHHPYQGGIDYMKYGGEDIATSIVASGGYDDDMNSADVLIYSGQGGNQVGRNKQYEDQKLVRGNLALKNSISVKNPVRVIRGFRETKASDGRAKMAYTYDGLYLVKRYWQEPGPHGKLVYKFELARIPGQRELAWKEVKNSKKNEIRKGLCVDDISGGKETPPICAVNSINNEKPPPFTYMSRMMYPDWYRPNPPKGCDCTDECLDPKKCLCAVKNGGEIPYNHNRAIVEVKPLVYECGPSCKCSSTCCNRVSQKGIKIHLEIFKTDSRGWGVRSLTSIPSGSFICEYTGEILEDKEADQRTGYDEYLFDIGQSYKDWSLGDETQTRKPDVQPSYNENVGYTIDAAQYGNVGRFINHSCSPNLYAQNVLYDHDDKRMPHIMLFAADNIPPLKELSYHYNYMVDQIRDSDGKVKKKRCFCGSTVCTGWMY